MSTSRVGASGARRRLHSLSTTTMFFGSGEPPSGLTPIKCSAGEPVEGLDVLNSALSLALSCATSSQQEQRRAAELLATLLERGGGGSLAAFGKLFMKAKGHDKDRLKHFLRSFETCSDDMAMILLCRMAEALYMEGGLKRQRKIVKADATSSLIRALRHRLRDQHRSEVQADSPSAAAAEDAIAMLILTIGARDPRVTLKLRVCGLLTMLCQAIVDSSEVPLSDAMLRLLCRAVRSPRNGQLAGRQRDFVNRLMYRILSVQCDDDSETLAHLARYLELLYFITRNRRTRVQLINNGVVAGVQSVLALHLNKRSEGLANGAQGNGYKDHSIHSEIALIALALLRLLTNNKKAKEELASGGTITMCERYIAQLAREPQPSHDELHKQIQDSLCSLCLRCLPQLTFPIANGTFPVRFQLPRVGSSPSHRRSTSKTPNHKTKDATVVDETALSSDDEGMDEEDVVFVDGDSDQVESDGDDAPTTAAADQLKELLKNTRQNVPDLQQQYDRLFVEYVDGAGTTKSSEPIVDYEKRAMANVLTTRSVMPWHKVPYHQLIDADIDQARQPLEQTKDSMRDMIMHEMARARLLAPFEARVVYDLDALLNKQLFGDAAVGTVPSAATPSRTQPDTLQCNDLKRLGKLDKSCDHLCFESRFESGNLRRATQISPTHYELILSPDVNQHKEHYHWYYFEVSNMKANVPYTFEIVNCMKTTSMYGRGMQPVMFSVQDAVKRGGGGWARAGENCCYYRNLYTMATSVNPETGEERGKKKFYSIRFNVTFRHEADVVYLAYHYPYTHSYLKTTIDRLMSALAPSVYCRRDVITESLGGNPITVLTVTAPGSAEELRTRELVTLSARVHPGEANSSWMMHGLMQFLLTANDKVAQSLRARFIFKLVPMLNPDGVINGSHRCSLVGTDLNRTWDRPKRLLHPEIFHSKGVIQYMTDVLHRAPFAYVDLHGHSRRSNVFMYGNNPEESWLASDKQTKHDYEFLDIPEQLDQSSASFSFKNCRFGITRVKEMSARVAVWRQFEVVRSYTLEASYSGFEAGPYKGSQIGTRELKEMGRDLLYAIYEVHRNADRVSPSARKATTGATTALTATRTSPPAAATSGREAGEEEEE